MIDEKVLICQIKDFTKHLNVNSVNSDYLTGYISALSVIEKMLASQPKVGEWIPCSERMPKYGQYVLVTIESASGEKFVRYERIRDGKWWLFETESVKAWMPLPEPYREDGDNDG